jgi:hypothetical protein
MEYQRALYSQDSNLRRRDPVSKEWTKHTGKGLFSHLSYKKGENIAEFVGTWRTKLEYETLTAVEPWRRAYSIMSTQENGDVLDYYDTHKAGKCVASFANSPIACWDVVNDKKAVENCCIVFHKRRIFLQCGVKTVKHRSPHNFIIPAHTELLFNYNTSYVSYGDK